MPELRALLKKNDLALRARSLFLRRPRSEGIIRFNAPFNCFRTSRSLLWPLKWLVVNRNNDLLFHVSDLPFHLLKIITCSKQWKGALMRLRHSNFSDLVMLFTMMLFFVYITTPLLLSAAYRCRTNFWLYRDICALRDNAVKKSVNDADHCMEVYSWCWTVIEQYYCTITKKQRKTYLQCG